MTSKIEGKDIKCSSDVDENLVHGTLQELRASGERSAVFQIKIQVKNKKVNALFDCGYQYNLIFASLVNELGLETYEHP